MAEQEGILPLRGTIGKINFYRSKAVFLARAKTSVNKERIANDPGYIRTRENGAEFGRAGKAAKLLKDSLRALTIHAADSRMTGRLVKRMMKVIQADAINARGLRNVIDGEAELLQDFEFNKAANLSSTLYAPFATSIDRATGELSVSIPVFIPMNMLSAPTGATHFKINVAGASIDFEKNSYEVKTISTAELPWTAAPTAQTDLSVTLTAGSTHPLFLALGVEFLQKLNGEYYSLKSGTFNALALVKVSGL